MTLGELLLIYLEKHSRIYKKSYASDQSKVNCYLLPRLGHIDLNIISRRDIADYIQGLDGLKLSTINRHIFLLKAVFTWAVDWNYISSSPVAGFKTFKEPASLRRAMEPGEYRTFMQVLDAEIKQEPRDTLLTLAFLALTGMRLGEARSADIQSVNMNRKTLFLHDTKSGDSRLVPLCQKAMDIVLMQKNKYGDEGLLFRAGTGGMVTEPRRLMTAICAKAGIGRFTIHELRYTAGSAMLAVTRDIYAVKRLLGHRSIRSTEVYATYLGGQQHEDIERAIAMMLSR
ncbi:tyrosine-type recombinase/integrase [Yersinia intermedia]|uniref:tyrosine-type recombinase/integrase n=1 Tax=Yersinia intermedia TaxID=631 RepID=UPI00384EF5C3